MSLRLLDEQKVGEGMLGRLVFELQQLQREVDQVGAAQAEFVNRALVTVLGLRQRTASRTETADRRLRADADRIESDDGE